MKVVWLAIALLFSLSSIALADEGIETTLTTKVFTAGDARVETRLDIKTEEEIFPELRVVVHPRLWINSAGWSPTSAELIGESRSTPYLVEGYAEWKKSEWLLRLGQQKIELGQIDKISPLNIWGPVNIRDPLDAETASILTGLLRYTPNQTTNLELLWSPNQARSDLPQPGDSWWIGPIIPLERTSPSGNSLGLRLKQSIGKTDWQFIWARHIDSSPAFTFVPTGLREEYVRETVLGGSVAFPLGKWMLTAEAASHQPDRLKDHYLGYVIQAERIWNLDQDRTLVLDFGYADRLTTRLIDPTSIKFDWPFRQAIYFSVSHSRIDFAGRDTAWRMRAMRQAAGDWYFNPEWSRQLTNSQRLTIGLDLLGGPTDTFFGMYQRNSRTYLEYKVKF